MTRTTGRMCILGAGAAVAAMLWLAQPVFLSGEPQTAAAGARPRDGKLRIIAFGAHPDDMEFKIGGVAALWAAAGHHVKIVSMTNGDQGHYRMGGGELARRRKAEVEETARRLGIEETLVLDNPDEYLEPSVANRRRMIHLIRDWQAAVVISHRPYDYNPDHRYTGVLAQDSAFVVTLQNVDLNSEPVERNPVFLFTSDRFMKPIPFQPEIAVAIDDVFDQKVRSVHALESQLYEGYLVGRPREERFGSMPKDDAGRLASTRRLFEQRDDAGPWRAVLAKWYGAARANAIKYAEPFEINQYGRVPTDEEIRQLFPSLPAR